MVRPTLGLLRARALTAALEAARHAETLMNGPPPPSLNVYLATDQAVKTMDRQLREPMLELLQRHDAQIWLYWDLIEFLERHATPCMPDVPHMGTLIWGHYEAFVARWRALGALQADPTDRWMP